MFKVGDLENLLLSRRKFMGLAGMACIAPALSGCTEKSVSYKYRFTLSLNTPDGVKTGSVVNEVGRARVYQLPMGEGYPSYQIGQALFVDMGPGKKPLIALLKGSCDDFKCPRLSKDQQVATSGWTYLGPTAIFDIRPELKGPKDPDPSHYDLVYKMERWKQKKVHLDLRLEELPELITFSDINDPLTVQVVDPWKLEDSFGPGVSWNSMTIDIVDDATPVVFDLETKLPWFSAFKEKQKQSIVALGIDGQPAYGIASGRGTLFSQFGAYDFEHRGN